MATLFDVPGKPQGKARARTVYNKHLKHATSYTPEKTVLYENLIKSCYPDNGDRWFNGEALHVCIAAYFDIPKSTTKKERERMLNNEVLPTKKPDADNIAKCVCDALNGIAYKDDVQVVNLSVCKKYTDGSPRVTVFISKEDYNG